MHFKRYLADTPFKVIYNKFMEFNETAKLCRLYLCLVVKRQKWGEGKSNKRLTIKLTDSFRNWKRTKACRPKTKHVLLGTKQ